MDALSALKEACQQVTYKSSIDVRQVPLPVKSLSDLAPGEYIVSHFEKVQTKNYGERMRIIIDGFYMYLPNRFNEALSQDQVGELNQGPKVMIYGGKDALWYERLILDFKEPEYFVQKFLNDSQLFQ